MTTPEAPPGDLRVPLASERTLLAWIRTGLALMGFGFIVARLGLFLRAAAGLQPPAGGGSPASLWIGTALVFLGVAVQIVAAWRHRRFMQRWTSGTPELPPWTSFGALLALAVAVLGIAMAAFLLSLG